MIEQGEDQQLAVPMTLVVPDSVLPIQLSCRLIYDEAMSLLKELYVTRSAAQITIPSASGVEMNHYVTYLDEIS
jgi:hypothetical protein